MKKDSSSTTELLSIPCTSESPGELQRSPTARLDPSRKTLESLGVEHSQDKDGDKKRRENTSPRSPVPWMRVRKETNQRAGSLCPAERNLTL